MISVWHNNCSSIQRSNPVPKVQLRNYAVNLNGNGCGATGLENAVCSILDERPKAAINKNDDNSAHTAVKSTECDTVRQRSGSDSSQEVFTTVASNPKTGFTAHATIGMCVSNITRVTAYYDQYHCHSTNTKRNFRFTIVMSHRQRSTVIRLLSG